MTSIKNKITLGTVFLLSLLVISGTMSIYFQVHTTRASENILKDNYESLDYCHGMWRQLDSMAYPGHAALFDSLLTKQERNITEPGELAATQTIRNRFDRLAGSDTSVENLSVLRSAIRRVLDLNMGAIQRKKAAAERSADNAYAGIILMVSITCILGLTYALNFPSIIVDPIEKLTAGIRAVSAKQYSHRVHIDSRDEFGQLAEAFNSMSGRLEEFENSNLNKLMFEKARAEAVINSLRDASIGIDHDNRVLFANAQALQLLSLKSNAVVGRQVGDLSRQNDLFRHLLENDSTAPFKVVVDGKENFYVRETVEVGDAATGSKVIVLKNITSFKELDVAKTNFIATVSHELKTPLASSNFSLKLLEDSRVGTLAAEQRHLVEQLKNDNQRMLRILSELLNMTQVEAGRIQLSIQRIPASQIVDASLRALDAAVKEKDLKVTAGGLLNVPDIMADGDKITWVLNNFLSNAVKFSPRGSEIELQLTPVGTNLQFTISDRGPGISEAYMPRVFDRYFQVPGSGDAKGSGIGLAICKELVEAMGGTVWVKARSGGGSEFGFAVPIAPESQP